MIVVDPTKEEHSFNILPRYYTSVTLNITVQITDEDTRRDLTHSISSVSISDGSLLFKSDAKFKENATYRIKITDTEIEEVVFRGKIFATDQSKQNYLINEK